MSEFKPLLAAKLEDTSKVAFPVIASPKIDGVRCIIKDGVAFSRQLKPFPNQWLQLFASEFARAYGPHMWDGEVIAAGGFQETQSECMSNSCEPFNFDYWVFDIAMLEAGYQHRLAGIRAALDPEVGGKPYVLTMPPNVAARALALEAYMLADRLQLAQYHSVNLERGFEGTMLRAVNGPYKHGRSTVKEGTLLKHKPIDDSEFVIIECFEEMENTNEAKTNALGHTARSHEKAGMVPKGVLGGFVCRQPMAPGDKAQLPDFKVGSGFTAEQRAEFWKARGDLIGKTITVQHQGYGSQGRPRFPVFKGFRPEVENLTSGCVARRFLQDAEALKEPSGAFISDDGIYRYLLWRSWDENLPILALVMLNPSTADARKNDPTIRRAIAFAKARGFGGIIVVNLFAFRATDPRALRSAPDPVGPSNAAFWERVMVHANEVLFAWGSNAPLDGLGYGALDTACGRSAIAGKPVWCLGRTKNGEPRHPLYVRADAVWERVQ